MVKKKSPPPVAKKASSAKPKCWVGFDLGGTKMLACVLDDSSRILATARKATNGTDGVAKGMKRIAQLIREALAEAGMEAGSVQGIGIGCPGLVDPSKGILLTAPNLGWKNVAMRRLLSAEFHCPVALLNDVDAGTFGEFKLGAARGARSLLGVFPGTGLGAGFVYNGQLVRGKSISCMELGHMVLPGTYLGSSQFGTVILEDLTSRLALASTASLSCYRGQLEDMDRKTGGSLREIKSKVLAGSFKEGDEVAMQMFRNSIRYLGMGVATVVNLFAPDHITLGGGLVEELPSLYINALKEEVARYAMPELAKGVKYSFAKLGGNAVAIGSVAYLREFGEN
jgi:glucokinase